MHALILASESVQTTVAVTPPGDEFSTLAYAALGLAMLVAAIATWVVTPKGHH